MRLPERYVMSICSHDNPYIPLFQNGSYCLVYGGYKFVCCTALQINWCLLIDGQCVGELGELCSVSPAQTPSNRK